MKHYKAWLVRLYLLPLMVCSLSNTASRTRFGYEGE
jgi:hypothetical protein